MYYCISTVLVKYFRKEKKSPKILHKNWIEKLLGNLYLHTGQKYKQQIKKTEMIPNIKLEMFWTEKITYLKI